MTHPQTKKPTPHLDKLNDLSENPKLPQMDRALVAEALARYRRWIDGMEALASVGDTRVRELVDLLNRYKFSVEMDLIWDSKEDFLFRQRGQTKLDNSIVEEFLPWLIDERIIPELQGRGYLAGPRTAFAAAYFISTLGNPGKGAGLSVRSKAQDFTVSREAFLKASFSPGFPVQDSVTHRVSLAYVAAEIKTNLDKTMFQEAIATAHDLKIAIPGARYYLLCEWLDMTPISTSTTDIDEVLILRGKRLGSNVRQAYSAADSRKREREAFAAFLQANPIRRDTVLRFVNHVRHSVAPTTATENDVLTKGYF